jgi:hypothetical protein
MSSPEPSAALRNAARAFAPQRLDRGLSIRDSIHAAGMEAAKRESDCFSMARIYATFQLKRDAYFPPELGGPAFDMLVDVYLCDWLNRRARAQQASGLRLDSTHGLPPGALPLVEAGLAVITWAETPEKGATLNLTRAGRARLNLYFEHMASYISAI